MRDKTLELEKRRIVKQKIKDFELKQQQDAAAGNDKHLYFNYEH